MFFDQPKNLICFVLLSALLFDSLEHFSVNSFPLNSDQSAPAQAEVDNVNNNKTDNLSLLSSTTTTTTPVTTTRTERPPNNVSGLAMTPDVNHALTIDHQNSVINLGESLSLGITNAIVRPLTFFNNLIGSAAGSLPGIFAANGAALGAAIATPIQMGTLAANAAISGITGTVVSIPISLASGGAAQLVGLVGTGRQLWQSTLGSDPNTSRFWQNGEVWLQPLALVTGANSILAGVSLNLISQGVKNLGLGIERFGVTLTNTGTSAKHLGSVLVGWANGKPIYAPVVNNTKTHEIDVDLSEIIKLDDTNASISPINKLNQLSINELSETETSTAADLLNQLNDKLTENESPEAISPNIDIKLSITSSTDSPIAS